MARRRQPAEGRATLVWAAWEALKLDDWRHRLDPTYVGPSKAATAALEQLDDDEATFLLELVDGTNRQHGSVAEIIGARFGWAPPPRLPDAVPLAAVPEP